MERRNTHERCGKSKSATHCWVGMLLRHAWDSLLSCRPVQPNTDTSQYLCNMHINRNAVVWVCLSRCCSLFYCFSASEKKAARARRLCMCVGSLRFRHGSIVGAWVWVRVGYIYAFLPSARPIDGAHFFGTSHVSCIPN